MDEIAAVGWPYHLSDTSALAMTVMAREARRKASERGHDLVSDTPWRCEARPESGDYRWVWQTWPTVDAMQALNRRIIRLYETLAAVKAHGLPAHLAEAAEVSIKEAEERLRAAQDAIFRPDGGTE
jgi:hypothetical protein